MAQTQTAGEVLDVDSKLLSEYKDLSFLKELKLKINTKDHTKPLSGDTLSLSEVTECILKGKDFRALFLENPHLFITKGAALVKLAKRCYK